MDRDGGRTAYRHTVFWTRAARAGRICYSDADTPYMQSLWAPAQRKRATMLYFANVFIYLFIFYGRLILRPWLTEVRENFTRGGP